MNPLTPKFKMQYYLQSVKKKKESPGVPTVAHWVKNPAAVAQVARGGKDLIPSSA